jgi:hypothetical protein
MLNFLLVLLAAVLFGCSSIWSTDADGFRRELDRLVNEKATLARVDRYFSYWGYEVKVVDYEGQSKKMTVFQEKSGCRVAFFFDQLGELSDYRYESRPNFCVYQRRTYLFQ